MRTPLAWLESRTGYGSMLRNALYETVPGGASWRHVWGSALVFTFFIQIVTGLFLWLAYSPSTHTAWESVYFLQYRMTGGWLLRGLHHYTADVMIVLLVLHLMQVVVAGAYRAPREVNFWTGLALLLLCLALSLTGYLLPWDQRGFCATGVATSIMGITPAIGPQLKQVALGGTVFGHHTLTRFFALHAGFLPVVMAILIASHVHLLRRHGRALSQPTRRPDCAWWPDQALKDAVACFAVLAAVLFLIVKPSLMGGSAGAPLGAPADPSDPFASYAAARPEWYFLFLFQLLKYFPGRSEIWGAIVIPGLTLMLVAAMPWLGRWNLGHRFNLGFLCVILVAIATLSGLAISEDWHKPEYQAAVSTARVESQRAKQLAGTLGIPAAGAASLLQSDPLTEGPKLFARNCAGCHRYGGTDGLGQVLSEKQSASDLKGYASRRWITGLIDPRSVASISYMGGSSHTTGEMVRFVSTVVAGYTPEKKAQLAQIIAAVSAEAQLPRQHDLEIRDNRAIRDGRDLLADGNLRCTECHRFHAPDDATIAPDLTGYGSHEWQVSFISNPADSRFYGKSNDRMPRFGEDHILLAEAIGVIADWLREDWVDADKLEAPHAASGGRL